MRNFSLIFLLALTALTTALPVKSTGGSDAKDAEVASSEPVVPETTTSNLSPRNPVKDEAKDEADPSAESSNKADEPAPDESIVPKVTIRPMGENGAYILTLTGLLPEKSKLSSITTKISKLLNDLKIKGGNVGTMNGNTLHIPLAEEAFKQYYDATKTPHKKLPTEFNGKFWPELEKIFPGIVKPENLPKVE